MFCKKGSFSRIPLICFYFSLPVNRKFLRPVTLNILCVASSADIQSVLCQGLCLRQHTLFRLVWSGVLDCHITLCHACSTPYLQAHGPLTLNSVVLRWLILTFSSLSFSFFFPSPCEAILAQRMRLRMPHLICVQARGWGARGRQLCTASQIHPLSRLAKTVRTRAVVYMRACNKMSGISIITGLQD